MEVNLTLMRTRLMQDSRAIQKKNKTTAASADGVGRKF